MRHRVLAAPLLLATYGCAAHALVAIAPATAIPTPPVQTHLPAAIVPAPAPLKAPSPAPPPLAPPAPRPPCPPEMALVNRTCVDRWEASLVQVSPDGSEKPWSPYYSPAQAGSVRAVSEPGVVPQAYISGMQAALACRNAGKRLCTAAEWETACRGPHHTIYPYGNRRRAHVCNDDGRAVHPVVDLTERLGLPAARMWYENMDHPLINQLPNTLRKTGELTGCTNEYGVYDMVGNLHEWIEDPAGTFRGGFYMDTKINGEGCKYATTAHNARYHDYSTGFRCCMDATEIEPLG